MIRLFVVLALLLAAPAFAHKVVFSVFASGDVIEGDVGFSSGTMAAGQDVQVSDDAGEFLGRALTDAQGFFVYRPTAPVTHVFRVDLGAGHVAETEMSAAEVAKVMGVAPAVAPQADETNVEEAVALSEAQSAEIAAILRDELRPLRREIAAYKEKNDLQTVLGGLGYIIGLFGVGFYVAARRKLKVGDE